MSFSWNSGRTYEVTRTYLYELASAASSTDGSMLRSAEEIYKLEHLNCLAVGPGLGRHPMPPIAWNGPSNLPCPSCWTPTR